MGYRDRDYYRSPLPRAGFGHFSAWSVTTWLIVINVVVMFADGASRRAVAIPDDSGSLSATEWMLAAISPVERWGYFSTATAIMKAQIWRFFTFQFLHASPFHLIANMIGLYFFGPIVEGQFGPRRFLGFYLLCGLAGAALYLLLSVSHILVSSADTPLIGASAGVFGLLVAAAMIAPDVELFYYLFPITIRTAAMIAMLLAAYSVISSGFNAGGEAAHLGGGILGFTLMKHQHWLNFLTPTRQPAMATARGGSATVTSHRKRKRRLFQKDWTKDMNR